MMRNLLALLATLVLLFSVLGSWRGWYRVERQPAEQGQSAFRVEFDHVKVGEDCVGVGKSVYQALTRGKDDQKTETAK